MNDDPWYFQRWARKQKLGNATRKLILTSLAITAEATSGSGFASQEDLAGYAECSVRTVSTHLKVLEEDCLISRKKRFSRNGYRLADGFILLAPGVESWPDGDEITTGKNRLPEDSSTGNPLQGPPERAVAGQELPKNNPSPSKNGRARPDEVPGGFPDELRPHARSVFRILVSQSEAMNVKKISARALGHVIMGRPHKPLVKSAHDYCAWLDGKSRSDLVAGYRNWLDGAEDLAGTELLDDNGQPAARVAPLRLAHSQARPMSATMLKEQRLAEQGEKVQRLLETGALDGLFGKTAS
jgi:hypothetical protein